MALATKGTRLELPPLEEGECYVCSCTEENACTGGCSWADDDHTLCSVCRDIGASFLEWLVAHSYSRNPAAGGTRCPAEVEGGRCAGLIFHEGEHYANARDRKAVR